MYMRLCLHVCLCTMHMPCALKAQKKALGHLELGVTNSCAQATTMWVLGIEPKSFARTRTLDH